MNAVRLAAACGSLLIVCSSALAATTTGTRAIPPRKPDLAIVITRKAGNCPHSIALWTWSKQYEGGGNNFVVADTLAVAGPAKRTRLTKTSVEFTAALRSAFASCAGAGANKDFGYSFALADGSVRFRIMLTSSESHPTALVDTAIVQSRPFAQWAFGD